MRTNREWRKLYFNYVRSYNKINKELIKKYGNRLTSINNGRGMADKKLDYWNWKDVYSGLEMSRLAEQEAGTRGKSLNINRDILVHQKFNLSYGQGKALLKAKRTLLKNKLKTLQRYSPEAKAIREELKSINLEKLRLNMVDISDITDTIKAMNKDLKLNPDYADSYDRSKFIGQLYFGS